MILALNIYAIVCGLVMDPAFTFFEDPNADRIMKLLVVGGGAWSVQKTMALVGNLISSGAGSNELRDHTLTAGRLAGKVGGALATVTGVRAVKSILSDALSMKSRDLGSRLAGVSDHNSGKGGSASGNGNTREAADQNGTSGATNNEKPTYGNNPSAANQAINNNQKQFKMSDWGLSNNDNTNTSKVNNNKGNGMINNAINGDRMETKGQNKQDENQQKGDK
jgi:hypothetical protein